MVASPRGEQRHGATEAHAAIQLMSTKDRDEANPAWLERTLPEDEVEIEVAESAEGMLDQAST